MAKRRNRTSACRAAADSPATNARYGRRIDLRIVTLEDRPRAEAISCRPDHQLPRPCGHVARRELAGVARAPSQWHQQREGAADEVVDRREHRVEAADAEPQRRDADHLERSHLPQRRDSDAERRPRTMGRRSQEGRADVETAARLRQQSAAQAEHVDAVACHRRDDCVGDDRHRHPQGLRLQRHRAVDARRAEGLRVASGSTGDTPRRRCCTRERSTSRCCTG